MSYEVPQHIAPNKIFIVNFSELEGRLEPEFYRPSIASLEKRIRYLSSHKLKDFALSMAGGIILMLKMEYHFLESKIFKQMENFH